MAENSSDIEHILSKRKNNGGEFWTTPDGKVGVGEPFSTISALLMLHELGLDSSHEAVAGAIGAILDNWKPDGRLRVAPHGAIYPCHTSNLARLLTRFGLAEDERVKISLDQLLNSRHTDGGWRCNRVPLGKSEITDASNPGVTLFALDALRFQEENLRSSDLDPAIESLLDHWDAKLPTGPCRFGIGTLFKQVEYPFFRYNLFYYLYVLSFYPSVRQDSRFLDALDLLESKLDEEGMLIVERPHRLLSDMDFCKKGQPSKQATLRYTELKENLELKPI